MVLWHLRETNLQEVKELHKISYRQRGKWILREAGNTGRGMLTDKRLFVCLFVLLLIQNTSVKEAVSINALCAGVYIYIRQLSSFRAPMLWFINLTVST